jgi:hypothetical protein
MMNGSVPARPDAGIFRETENRLTICLQDRVQL